MTVHRHSFFSDASYTVCNNCVTILYYPEHYYHTHVHTNACMIGIHVHMDIDTHRNLHFHRDTQSHTRSHTHACTYTHRRMHVHTQMYTRTHTHTHIDTYIHTDACMHTHTHTHVYTHIDIKYIKVTLQQHVSSLLGSMTVPGGHLTHNTLLSRWVMYIVKPHNASTNVIFLVMWRSCPSLLKSVWSVICRRTMTSPASMSGCKTKQQR